MTVSDLVHVIKWLEGKGYKPNVLPVSEHGFIKLLLELDPSMRLEMTASVQSIDIAGVRIVPIPDFVATGKINA